jgi:hypothetical protein
VSGDDLVVSALRADGTVEEAFSFDVARSGRDVTLTATCTAAEPVEAGLRVELRLGPTDDPGWLVPGLVYGENRPEICTRRYPRWVTGRVDLEAMESDAWSFRADRAATPAVFAWDGEGGAALVTTEESALGQSGVGFAHEDGRPVLRLHFPYREEPLRYDGSETHVPVDVRTHRWSPGESQTVALSVYDVGPDRHAYTDVLRDVHARGGPLAGDVAWVTVEQAAELAAWGLYRWHYRPDPARLIETAAFDRHAFGDTADRDAMHVSWVSGTPYAYALLRHGVRTGRADYAEAATAVLDHVAANLTPGGTFWAQWTATRGWTTGWHPDHKRLHARTLADATLFMQRATMVVDRPAWSDAVRSNIDVVLRTQRDDGALPSAHHVDTGEAVSWDGTAGLAWIPALVEAGEHDAARRRTSTSRPPPRTATRR